MPSVTPYDLNHISTVIIRPGRSIGEHSLYAVGGTCRPLTTNQLVPSVSFKTGWFSGTLKWFDSWLLLLLPAGRGCKVIWRWWPRPSTVPCWCHGEAGIRLFRYSLLLPPFQPSPQEILMLRPPHPLTYTNVDIETEILAYISTDTNRLTKILYCNSTNLKTAQFAEMFIQNVTENLTWVDLLVSVATGTVNGDKQNNFWKARG